MNPISRYKTVGDLIFLSGITSNTGDAPTQMRGCFEKIKETLTEAGGSMESVLTATVYLSDLSDREKHFNAIWKEYFPTNPPTRTTVQVGIGQCKVEITVVAAKKVAKIQTSS